MIVDENYCTVDVDDKNEVKMSPKQFHIEDYFILWKLECKKE